MMTRLAAAPHGEVAATTAEAYRRAGASADQDMMDAEQLRGSLAASAPDRDAGGRPGDARPCREGGPFICRLFHSTSKVDYCDPQDGD